MTIFAIVSSLLITGFHATYFAKYIQKVKNAKKIIGAGMSVRKGIVENIGWGFMTAFLINTGLSAVTIQQAMTGGDAVSAFFLHLLLQLFPLPFFVSSLRNYTYLFMKKKQYITLEAIIKKDELYDWQNIVKGHWVYAKDRFYSPNFDQGVLDRKIIHEEYVQDIGETKEMVRLYLKNKEAIQSLSGNVADEKELKELEKLNEFQRETRKELSERFERLFIATGKKETSAETELRLAKAREQLRMLPEQVATKETRMPVAQEALLEVIADKEMPEDMKEMAQKVFDEIEKKKAVKELDTKREEAERTIRAAMLAHHVSIEEKA